MGQGKHKWWIITIPVALMGVAAVCVYPWHQPGLVLQIVHEDALVALIAELNCDKAAVAGVRRSATKGMSVNEAVLRYAITMERLDVCAEDRARLRRAMRANDELVMCDCTMTAYLLGVSDDEIVIGVPGTEH